MTKEEKILQFLVQNKGKFNNSQVECLRSKLNNANEADIDKCSYISLKNPWVTFILNFFLWELGAGYFYLGKYSLAVFIIIANLILTFLDIFLIFPTAIHILMALAILFSSFWETRDCNFDEIYSILKSKL